MKTHIIDIGTSKGIRLSKPILRQCNITDWVDLNVEKNRIILTPAEKKEVRKNWQHAFQKMAERKEDTLLIKSVPYNDKEWQWR